MIIEPDRISAYIAQANAEQYARYGRQSQVHWVRIYNQQRAAIWYARARRAMGIEP